MRSPARRRLALLLLLALPVVGAGCGGGGGGSEGGDEPAAKPAAPTDAGDHEKRYLVAKTQIEGGDVGPEVEAELRAVANEAKDAHLRANASLLLGSILEAKGDRKSAIAFYRQARVLVPEEAEVHAVLALALAAEKDFDEAIEVQNQVVNLVPDDLQAWLILGELNVKGGKEDGAKAAYAGYELRRKGLLDGLTLTKGESYVLSPTDRAECAFALGPALDNGTALALLYALDSDPDAGVRATVASVMGEQRLTGYKPGLEAAIEKEKDADAKAAMVWALAEIERDPVETAPGAAPADAIAAAEGDTDGQGGDAPGGSDASGETGSPAESPAPAPSP